MAPRAEATYDRASGETVGCGLAILGLASPIDASCAPRTSQSAMHTASSLETALAFLLLDDVLVLLPAGVVGAAMRFLLVALVTLPLSGAAGLPWWL